MKDQEPDTSLLQDSKKARLMENSNTLLHAKKNSNNNNNKRSLLRSVTNQYMFRKALKSQPSLEMPSGIQGNGHINGQTKRHICTLAGREIRLQNNVYADTYKGQP